MLKNYLTLFVRRTGAFFLLTYFDYKKAREKKRKMKYGLPYKGSKNKLAEKICALFPKRENFYDLFCGGAAITHRMLIENRFKNYYMNDINGDVIKLFWDAVHGRYKNETRWISREDFFKLKDTDPYIATCWSFGNNLKQYMYNEELEPYKKALHYAIVFKDFSLFNQLYKKDISFIKKIDTVNERRLALQGYLKRENFGVDTPLESSIKTECLLQSLNRLQSLETLERLERLESLERLEISSTTFANFQIKPDSVIYCDIPYANTDGYIEETEGGFNFSRFYDWALSQKELTFISSYEMPDDFIEIANFPHRCTLSANANNKVFEKVFIPKTQLEQYKRSQVAPCLFEDMF